MIVCKVTTDSTHITSLTPRQGLNYRNEHLFLKRSELGSSKWYRTTTKSNQIHPFHAYTHTLEIRRTNDKDNVCLFFVLVSHNEKLLMLEQAAIYCTKTTVDGRNPAPPEMYETL